MGSFLSNPVLKQIISFIIFSLFSSTCTYDAKSQKHELLKLTRSILNSGFHRILQYNASIEGTEGPTLILITETFPKDVYLDPYQIAKRLENNEIKIMTEEQINTEIPSYQAKSFNVQLCSVSKSNFHSFELPVHLRYQKPHDCYVLGDYVVIGLKNPTVYFKTVGIKEFPDLKCQKIEEYGSWSQQEVQMDTTFEVPVGCLQHFPFVVFLTLVTISVSSVYICSFY
ncbi:phosphatidylinositol-glycan biosynthesis class X protein [Trichonephila inaurata madagascariensis]|uniref:Phosphatidylinositol-glycan biosynthesis class X protein n=1 Tax=Trichonephila inaurata madagascariensis TaxID=2747483 RepID=A0A8X6J7M0_9ARAC|nr:phosphatidylinositol-glycan biosynthesis class X protein [Trichonephila inaurata madagascariensis]